MALRDHSLDDKITAAARKEFLDKGYTGASLRKIAEQAGVTVGAIQTRYKSKDELFALAFAAPYVVSEKKIPPETVQEMMRRSLYHIKWYFARTDLNTDKGKAENKKSVVKYDKWYTPEKEKRYPTSFKADFVGQPHEGACYYRITRCPICIYTEKLGVPELMPLFCELDEVMITLQHGVLYREQTLANGGAYCDYHITGNKE